MAFSDEEIEQINQNVDDRLDSGEKNMSLKKMSTTTKLLLAGGFAFFMWMILGKNLTNIQKGGLLVMLAVAIVFAVSYSVEDKRMLTEQELSAKAYQIMKHKQDHHFGGYYQVPKGDIMVDMEGGRKIVDGKPLYYERRVKVKPRFQSGIREYAMKQDLFTGDAIAFIEKMDGYSAEDVDQPAITLFGKSLRDDLVIDKARQEYRGK